jgi:signal transduction histidine kinase
MLPEFEKRYQQAYLATDIKQAKLGVLMLIIPLALLAFDDYLLLGLKLELYVLTALRLGYIVYSVLFMAYLNRVKSYRSYYKYEFVWGIAGMVFQLIVNATRPLNFNLHILTAIIVIFVTCLVIPQKSVNRIILSLIITLGELAIILSIPSLEIVTLFALVFSLTMANVIGLSSSKLLESYRKENSDRIEMMNEKLRVVGGLTRHDARNKLQVVSGWAHFLKKKHADEADVVEVMVKVEQTVKDVGAIFEFAKMYEQIGVEELTYVNVEAAVDEAAALFPGLTIKVVNDCHGLSLLADSFLRQLFYNFVDNTRKYGRKTTKIHVYFMKAEPGKLRLIYEDDGVGISAENKLKLFAEGFSTGGSTGFGLFLSKKMMDVYGWQIQEAGEPGKGAKFVITIPRVNQRGKDNFQITLPNLKRA